MQRLAGSQRKPARQGSSSNPRNNRRRRGYEVGPGAVEVFSVFPSGVIAPCQSKVAQPPSGPLWVHEIKHDGCRLMVCRDGARIRYFTRGGHDWADRFPAIVDASLLKADSTRIGCVTARR